MAVLQRLALFPNERFDTPDGRALEAYGLNDWRFFLMGAMTDKSKILTGFDITNYSSIFTVPGFKVKVDNVVLFHTEATSQAAGFYVFAGTEPDVAVTLSANATNFVEATLTVELATPDVRAFWDQGANSGAGGEFTDTVGTAVNLVVTITSNVTSFTAGKIPLYRVVTNSSGVATSVTDSRELFFRLGTGGTTPDPNHNYAWPALPDSPHSRLETPSTATSATLTNAPWQGGDKNITNFKAWMDAVMSSIKEVKGTTYWYMPGATGGGVPGAYQNAALTVMTSGTWQHTTLGHLALIGGSLLYRLGMSNVPIFSAFADIDLTTNPVFFVLLPATDSAITYGFGDDAATPIVPQAVTAKTTTSLTVPLGGNYVTTGGVVLAHGQEFSYTAYSAGTGLFSGVSPDPSGVVLTGDFVYQSNTGGVGYYHTSSVAAVPGVSAGVSMGAERVMWLAMYDGSSDIVLKNAELTQGEEIEVGDETPLNLLSYIGAPNDATNNPTYATTATGAKTGQTSYNSISTDNLTVRLSRITTMMADKAQDKTIRFVRDGIGNITNTTNGSNQDITFSGATPLLRLVMPSSTNNGQIGLGATLSLAQNQAAYFSVDRNAPVNIVDLTGLTISSIDTVPLDENTFIFALRLNTNLVYFWDCRRFNVGTYPADQDLSLNVRNRLGITGEDSFQPYSSTLVIAAGDAYSLAISKLDAAIGAILANNPAEESQIVGVGGTTTFTAASVTWNASNTNYDIMVFVNGRKQAQDTTGGLLQDFRKTSTTDLEFAYTVPQDARITVRNQNTGGGGGGGGGGPFANDLIPAADNTYDIGSSILRWKDGYFAGKLTVVGGIDPEYIQLTPLSSDAGVPNHSLWVDANDSNNLKHKDGGGNSDTVGAVGSNNFLIKIMTNDDSVNPIPAGTPVSKLPNGNIVSADSDAAQGQKYVGITMASIPASGMGAVVLPGPNMDGILTGLGFTPGDEVFLSETGGYTNNPNSFTGGDDSIIKVGIADCSSGVGSATVTDLIMFTDVLIRP